MVSATSCAQLCRAANLAGSPPFSPSAPAHLRTRVLCAETLGTSRCRQGFSALSRGVAAASISRGMLVRSWITLPRAAWNSGRVER